MERRARSVTHGLRTLGILALVGMAGTAIVRAQSVQVTPLSKDGRVLVSLRMTDVFTDEVRAAIHSGLAITFVYEVDLKRTTALWLDRTIASAKVTASVKYDNLTGRYLATRKEDGRIELVKTIELESVAREWLTEFDKLPLFTDALLEPNVEYYLRVRARTTPRNAAFVWPWEGGISGLAKFTFLR